MQNEDLSKFRYVLFLCLSVLLTASCLNAIHHDQAKAAKAAMQFARSAFIDKNYAMASKFADPKSVLANTDYLKTKLPSSSSPTEINASDFAPVPGEKAMVIFLIGRNESEQFYYQVRVHGDANDGYLVFEGKRVSQETFNSINKRAL